MNKLWMTFFKLMKIKGFFCHSWRRPWRAGAAGKSHTGKISGDRKPAPAEASGAPFPLLFRRRKKPGASAGFQRI
jgi:hypothetical protein